MTRLFQEIMAKRGFDDGFLSPKYSDLSDALELPDMDKATKRLIAAAEKQEKVLVYGDYDVDGVTASTVMTEALRLLGISDVEVMLPDRFVDGYGMSERVVERAKRDGASLVVSVDCGSNNSEVIDELAAEGVDVIVTDHHELLSGMPEKAVAVVNPKRADFRKKILARQAEILDGKKLKDFSGLEDLAGVGVAFMVAKALVALGKILEGKEKWLLDLVAIGTVCDSMTILKDNRILCYFGLIVLEKTRRPGLIEMKRLLKAKKMTTDVIGFQIGPRLNAAGRMETAELSLKLLMATSNSEAAKLAAELDKLNSDRKAAQTVAIDEIREKGIGRAPVIVVAGEWSEGIVGIIAGRLMEQYKRPTFVLTRTEEGYKGSGRSFGDFNLADALTECKHTIISGGGHAAAAGVKVAADRVEDFQSALNEYYMGLGLQDQERFLDMAADAAVTDFSELSLDFMDELLQLEPFGNGNAEPILKLDSATIFEVKKMGADGKHLRLDVIDGNGKKLKLVAFFAKEKWMKLVQNDVVDIWFLATINEWQGTKSVEGRILKIKEVSEYDEVDGYFPEEEIWEG